MEEAGRDIAGAQARLDALGGALNESKAKAKGLKEALRLAEERVAEATVVVERVGFVWFDLL